MSWQQRQVDRQRNQDDLREKDRADRYLDLQRPGSKGTADNPEDFTYSGEHTEAVMSDSGWDRDNQATGKDGFKITLQTGEAYYDTSDEKLYCYVRDFTFDSLGAVKSHTAERRVEVDAPEAC